MPNYYNERKQFFFLPSSPIISCVRTQRAAAIVAIMNIKKKKKPVEYNILLLYVSAYKIISLRPPYPSTAPPTTGVHKHIRWYAAGSLRERARARLHRSPVAAPDRRTETARPPPHTVRFLFRGTVNDPSAREPGRYTHNNNNNNNIVICKLCFFLKHTLLLLLWHWRTNT